MFKFTTAFIKNNIFINVVSISLFLNLQFFINMQNNAKFHFFIFLKYFTQPQNIYFFLVFMLILFNNKKNINNKNRNCIIIILYLLTINMPNSVNHSKIIDQKININIYNNIIFTHAYLVLVTIYALGFLIIETSYSYKHVIIKSSVMHAPILLILALFLGSIWSSQEVLWGGFWNWDLVEITIMIFVISSVNISHLRNLKNLNNVVLYLNKTIIFIYFIMTYANKDGFSNSVHSFTNSNITWLMPILSINFLILIIMSPTYKSDTKTVLKLFWWVYTIFFFYLIMMFLNYCNIKIFNIIKILAFCTISIYSKKKFDISNLYLLFLFIALLLSTTTNILTSIIILVLVKNRNFVSHKFYYLIVTLSLIFLISNFSNTNRGPTTINQLSKFRENLNIVSGSLIENNFIIVDKISTISTVKFKVKVYKNLILFNVNINKKKYFVYALFLKCRYVATLIFIILIINKKTKKYKI